MPQSNSSVFLILGPEEYLRKQRVAEIEKNLAKAMNNRLAKHNHYAFERDSSYIVDLLRSGSLFAEHALITYGSVELLNKKKDYDPLVRYIKQPAPSSTLVLFSDQYRVAESLMRAVPKQQQTVCWEQSKYSLQNRLRTMCRQYQVDISPEAVETLLEHVVSNSLDLERQIAPLCHFVGARKTINEQHIDEFLYYGRNESAFSLFAKIAECRFEEAVAVSQALFISKEGDPNAVIAISLIHLRKLHALRSMISTIGSERAFRDLAILGKRRQQIYRSALANYTADDIERILVLGGYFETAIRSGRDSYSQEMLLQFIHATINRKGRRQGAARLILHKDTGARDYR